MYSIKKISMQHHCVITKPPTWLKEESTPFFFFFEASEKMPAFNLHSIAFIQVTDNQHSSTRSCVDSQDNHYQHSSANWTHWQHTHEKYSSTLRRQYHPAHISAHASAHTAGLVKEKPCYLLHTRLTRAISTHKHHPISDCASHI